MGKTGDFFKRTRDIKEIFHIRKGTTKEDLTEAEEIHNRWQEYAAELQEEGLNDLDNHDGVVTHLKADFLKGEVKWALGSFTVNKASGGDGIPQSYFKS